MHGRSFVEPGDVKAVFNAVSCHRLIAAEQHNQNVGNLLDKLLDQISIP